MKNVCLNRLKKFFIISLIFTSVFIQSVQVVYAGEDTGTSGNTGEDEDSKQKNVQETRESIIDAGIKANMIGVNWTKEQKAAFVQCASDIVLALRSKGVSENAIAGIMLNMYKESHFDPYMIQGEVERQFLNFEFKTNNAVGLTVYDENMKLLKGKDVSDSTKTYNSIYTDDLNKHPGLGLVQVTKERRNSLIEYGRTLSGSDRCVIKLEVEWDYTYTDSNNVISSARTSEISVPNATLQTGYILESPKEGANQWNTGKANLEKYGLPVMEWEEFLVCDEPVDVCAKMFAVAFERPNDMDGVVNESVESSRTQPERIEFMTTLLGSDLKLSEVSTVGNVLSDALDTIMTSLATSGFWSENQVSSYCKLTEIDVQASWLEAAQRAYLSNRDLYELSNWERNVESDTIENILINGGRRIVIFAGILFEVWSILIYLAYWFDRINNFIEIDLLSILTFGRLRIADDISKATYSLRSNEKNKVKTVNHRAVVCIVLIGLTVGTTIISGKIFSLLYWLFKTVNKWLH